jgi:phytanoyl-CoA hydroxylase
MESFSKTLNGWLSLVNLHLGKASSFQGAQDELARRQERIDDLSATLKREADAREREKLLELSQTRWRADEPDEGLTWGVAMVGDEFVRFLTAQVPLSGSSTIVEIGPGYGRILAALLKHQVPFRRYIGLEISAARVARLRNEFRDPRIEFREADVLAGLELDATADLTFSSAVFEHLYPDFGAALKTISTFTKPGGAVVLDFVRADETLETAQNWFERETYIRVYSLSEMKAVFAKHAFTLNRHERVSFGGDINNREITRTVVFGTLGGPAGPSLETLRYAQAQPAGSATFDQLVHHKAASDPFSLNPPVKPEFRNPFGGLWTDLNTAGAIVAGKLAIGEISPGEAKLVDAWRRDGLVILPGAVDAAAINAALLDFERAYDGTLSRKMSFWNDSGFHIENASRKYVRMKDAKLLDLHTVSSAVQSVVFAEAISRFLHILFERPALAFQSLGFYYGSQQEIHQDSAFVRVDSALELIASWVALEDIQPGSGELQYYPGSHALPLHLFGGKRVWIDHGEPEIQHLSKSLQAGAEQAGLSLQCFQAKKGDVVIWAASLMHGGSPVKDPNLTRKSIVTHYCPANLQPMFAYKPGRLKQRVPSGHYVMGERWEERESTFREG